jgi:hypothetical protein
MRCATHPGVDLPVRRPGASRQAQAAPSPPGLPRRPSPARAPPAARTAPYRRSTILCAATRIGKRGAAGAQWEGVPPPPRPLDDIALPPLTSGDDPATAYDVLIVGCGPAGVTTALHCAEKGLSGTCGDAF